MFQQNNDIEQRIGSIEGLVREMEKVSDPAVRSLSRQLMQSLMELHGSGIERMLEIVHGSGNVGQQIIDDMGRDNLVRSLLLLYGLHPVDMQTRILEALERTRPYLRSHGGNVELVHVSDMGAVTLRLEGSCHSCPSSAVTLQSTVEQAIYEAAPDVTAIVVEGVAQQPAADATFVPLGHLESNRNGHTGSEASAAAGPTDWQDVFGLDALPTGTLRKQEVGGNSILFCKLNDDLYAYGMNCPGCGQPLEGGRVENAILACPICQQRYDLVHAGRGLDVAALHLDPVPLLKENGRARVAILSGATRRTG
jgi:Fe-S cluster biogenesis protein NfuA/nitrite reductase/ring-hydroxylating ferredoxin subunit